MRTQGHQYIERSLRPQNRVFVPDIIDPPRAMSQPAGRCGVCVGRNGLDLGASVDARCRPPCAQQACSRCPPRYHEYIFGTFGHQAGAGVRQRLRSRASGPLGPAPAPPRGRTSADAARRLCGDMHVVFTRHCSTLLMTRLKATQRRYARSPRRSAAPQALCSNEATNEACASIGAHARNFASAADSASACCFGVTTAHVFSATNPQPHSISAGFGRHGRRFTRPRAWIVSGDENLAIKELFRTDLA